MIAKIMKSTVCKCAGNANVDASFHREKCGNNIGYVIRNMYVEPHKIDLSLNSAEILQTSA